jgi:hypothetical protein
MNEETKSPYNYRHIEHGTAFGDVYKFTGPNIGRYHNEVHLLQHFNDWASKNWTPEYRDHDAQKIVWMLNEAYEAGRKSMQKSVRDLLGIEQ